MNRVLVKAIEIVLVFAFGLACGWYIRGAFTEIEVQAIRTFEQSRLEVPAPAAAGAGPAMAIEKTADIPEVR